MHRFFIITILWLALALSGFAASVELHVTPKNLGEYKYVFLVSTNATQAGVAFRVSITAKTDDISSDSSADLKIVTHTNDGGSSIVDLEPAIRVTLKKDTRVWKADFVVSHQLLKKPGLCLVFTEFAHATIDGKSVAMPSATFYEIQLGDFVKP